MNSLPSPSQADEHAPAITRVAQGQWHAIEDDLVVGRGYASRRPDGRLFVGIDSWHAPSFDRLADALLADLPRPLYAVVDEADLDATADWRRAGFTNLRRERDYLVPTDPRVTGLGAAQPPLGATRTTILSLGQAQEGPLRSLDGVIRAEVEATVGWHTMPAEILPRPAGDTVVDPSKYAVAAQPDRYVGLVRVVTLTRRPRIGLIAVRAEQQRRGIARALLGNVLASLHDAGFEAASAEVDESNAAAVALFEGIGARHQGGNLELVLR
jgi:GNAT superfamily N-acetyltransferase